MEAVLTAGLSKNYGAFHALRGVSLRVPTGALFGFLGPNGAGKSTTIRILLGLLRASGGSARVLGGDAWRDGPRLRAQIGYLPGDVRFYDGLRGRTVLEFFANARGGRSRGEIARLAWVFDLDLNRRIRNYSRGMKQKLGLIQALMHRPQLLILDEPTTALDPLVRQTLFDELRGVAADGRTVLFSSHTLAEVEELCDHVAIVRRGELIEQSTIDALRARAVRHVEVVFDAPQTPPPAPEGLAVRHQSDGHWSAGWVGPIDRLIDWLHAARPRDVTIAPPDLEDLFMTYYADERKEPRA